MPLLNYDAICRPSNMQACFPQFITAMLALIIPYLSILISIPHLML